jgi:hypothetical protein
VLPTKRVRRVAGIARDYWAALTVIETHDRAKRNALFTAYRLKLDPIDQEYHDKLASLGVDHWASPTPANESYWADLSPIATFFRGKRAPVYAVDYAPKQDVAHMAYEAERAIILRGYCLRLAPLYAAFSSALVLINKQHWWKRLRLDLKFQRRLVSTGIHLPKIGG